MLLSRIENASIIYIVDDDAVMMATTVQVLKTMNPAAVIKTFNSAEPVINQLMAINYNDPECPSLVLLDIHMPGVGGWGLVDWLEIQQHFCLDIWMLSSSTTSEHLDKAFQSSHVTAYIVKPLTLNHFFSRTGCRNNLAVFSHAQCGRSYDFHHKIAAFFTSEVDCNVLI